MGKLKDYLYLIKRDHTKRKITGYLGKIDEYEDRILCFVEKKPKRNNIKCHSVRDYTNLAKKYKLFKPITYIFTCSDFNKGECVIEGDSDVNLTFNNCNFSDGLTVKQCNTLNIIHGRIGKQLITCAKTAFISDVNNNSANHRTLNVDITADNINIEGTSFEDKTNRLQEANYYINAKNNLTIRRSRIGRQNNNDIVEIYASSLESDNSTFATPVEKDDPQYLKKNHHTTISSSRIIKFYGNTDEIGNILIDAPEIIVNGTSYKYNVSTNQSIYPEVNLQRIISSPSVKKLQLIELLKKLQTKSEERCTEKRQQYDEELKNTPLKKLLEK